MQTKIYICAAVAFAIAMTVSSASMGQVRHMDPPVDTMRNDRIRYRQRTNWKMQQREPERIGNVWKSNIN